MQKMHSNGWRVRAARSSRAGVDLSCLRRIWTLAFALLLAASAKTIRAQTADENQNAPNGLRQLSLEQLGNLEVTTVKKGPEKIQRTPAAIYVLTQEDIRRSGATTIPELLRLVPGLEVARVSSDQWALGIRGFESGFSKSVLVLIDGRSVYTPLFEGVYWDVQNVMVEDIDRIEVIRGPGGTIWGANAVNGVINIITKNAQQTHGALASLGGGTVDQGTGSARYGGSVGPNADYRVYGMGFIRGAEFHPDANHFDEWRMGQLGFRTDWKRHDHDSFTIQGDIYRGANGEEKNVAFFHPPSQANIDTKAFVSGGNLLARWDHEFADGSDFQIQAYFDRTNRQDVQFGETRDTFDIDVVHHLNLPKHQHFIWGLGLRESPSNFIQTQATVDFLPHQETDSVYSGFLQDEIPILADKLSLTVGTKLERDNFSGFNYEPSARLLWTPSDRQSFWAAATRAVRTPSRLDQDLALTGFVTTTPLPIFIKIAGDPKFAAERLIGYGAGYRALVSSSFYLDISAFFNNYHGLLSFGPASISFAQSPPPSYTYLLITVPWANGLVGNTDGVEVSPNWKVTRWWQLKGSYSYLQMHLKDEPGITDAGTPASDVGSSPRHEIVIQSLFRLPGRFELDPTYRFMSALPAQSVKRYSTMDVHFGRSFAEDHFELSLTGQDLFRPSQQEYGLGVPNAPNLGIKRAVYAKATWRM